MGYTKQIASGISWVGLLRMTNRVIAFGKTAILARLLTPVEFGLFGVASIILSFLEMITETGINIFLIQEDDKDSIEKYLDTAWIVSIVRGVIIGGLIFIFAPFLASFFNSASALNNIRLIALVPIIRGFINPSIASYQKQMQFRKEFLFRLAITLVDTTVAIILSFTLRSSISLVIGMLAGSLVEVILSQILIKPRPQFIFDKAKWNLIINRGKWVTSAGILTYLSNQGPDFFIGKLLNSTTLGLYQMAYKLSMLFVTEINDIFNRVTFPVYVKIIQDKQRTFRAFVYNSAIVTFLVLPVFLLFMIFPREIVLIAVGEQWLSIVPMVQLLSIFGFIATIGTSISPMFLAAKHQDYLSHISTVRLLAMAIPIIPLIHRYGVYGAAYALIFSAVVSIPFKFWYVYKILRT